MPCLTIGYLIFWIIVLGVLSVIVMYFAVGRSTQDEKNKVKTAAIIMFGFGSVQFLSIVYWLFGLGC